MKEPQETWVQSLGLEDPLKVGMATHSSILAWETSWPEEPCGLQFIGSQRVGHDWTNLVHTHYIQGRGTRDQIANICWIIKKQQRPRKTSISALVTMPKPLTVWITTNCGKFLKRWEYQTTRPASREICIQVRKQVRTGHGTTGSYLDWFQIGKEVCQGCILSTCLFNLYAEYIMRNAGLGEAQAGIKMHLSQSWWGGWT